MNGPPILWVFWDWDDWGEAKDKAKAAHLFFFFFKLLF